MQPPHAKTLERLVTELQETIERDRQFINRAEELLHRWKTISQRMNDRFRKVLETESQAGSSSS